ncbi:MAG: DNA-3-methyladenine glycosylase I [Pseudomonadota bacterium]
MRPWGEIEAAAAARHGGGAALEALLPTPAPKPQLLSVPDDRWLSTLSRMVFSAGFNWKVVEQKWPAFEEAFHGFEPGPCSMMDEEAVEIAAKAGGIPHMAKAMAARDNAVWFRHLAETHGTAARYFVDWPSERCADLLLAMKKEGGRLGGTTAQYFLRTMEVDGFMISNDVGAGLVREGVVDRPPSSAKGLRAAQDAFNAWRAQSGRPLMQLSRILALSVE